MHYQLFFPQVSVFSPDLLQRAGLGTLLRDGDLHPSTFPLTGPGPDGNVGIVLDWGTPKPGYYPAEQTWRELPGSARCWIGVNTAEPPTPADLIRPTELLVGGFEMPLADGQIWTIPNVAQVPCRFGLAPSGQPERLPIARFGEFQALATELFDHVESELRDGTNIDWTAGLDYAAQILAVNFRVALPLCLAWELFDERNLGVVLRRAIDLERMRQILAEVAKKKITDEAEETSVSTPPG